MRIDFFAYEADGRVTRYHPGGSRASSMTPHHMAPGCPLFPLSLARSQGVGQVLHTQPPGIVRATSGGLFPLAMPIAAGAPQLGMPPLALASREDLALICSYDYKIINWSLVRDFLRGIDADVDQRIDWADGDVFPWWVWLANTGRVRDVVSHGVLEIHLEFSAHCKAFVVHSDAGEFRLYSRGEEERLGIKPVPPKFDAYKAGGHASSLAGAPEPRRSSACADVWRSRRCSACD